MFFLADSDSEKILKKLVGRTDIEDALLQLDMLTKEESLMILMGNLEVTIEVKRLSPPYTPIVDRQE